MAGILLAQLFQSSGFSEWVRCYAEGTKLLGDRVNDEILYKHFLLISLTDLSIETLFLIECGELISSIQMDSVPHNHKNLSV